VEPVPFLPTHSSARLPQRRTSTWPVPPSVARVAVPPSVARAERPSAARVVASLSVARVEPLWVGHVVEPLLLADATTEAFGMAPEGASGTGVGGHTV
jgi:hypothetical protein